MARTVDQGAQPVREAVWLGEMKHVTDPGPLFNARIGEPCEPFPVAVRDRPSEEREHRHVDEAEHLVDSRL